MLGKKAKQEKNETRIDMEADRNGSLVRNVQLQKHEMMKKDHHKNVQNWEMIQRNERHLATTSHLQTGNIPVSMRTIKVFEGSKTVLLYLTKKRKGY